MDSKHRHKLAQNDLLSWIMTQYNEWIQPNLTWIGWLVLGLVVVWAAFAFSSWIRERNVADYWEKYFMAFQSENPASALEVLAASTTGAAADQTRLTLGQILMNDAENALGSDKSQSGAKLEKAVDVFQKLLKDASSKELRQTAGIGLGQAFEALAATRTDKNDLAEAQKAYQAVVGLGADTFEGKKAQRQLDRLSKPDAKTFFEVMAKAAMEKPKADDFKVSIDPKDPFPNDMNNFDPQKALGGGGSALTTGLADDPKVNMDAIPAPAKDETPKTEEKKP